MRSLNFIGVTSKRSGANGGEGRSAESFPQRSPDSSLAFGAEVDKPVAVDPAQFAENKRRRAETRDNGLQEVESREGR